MRSAFLAFLCLCCLATLAAAAPSGFGKKKEPVPVIKPDTQHIRCQVCQLIAKEVHRSVSHLRGEQPKWRKLPEEEILTHLESVCNSQKEEGEWITRLDLQQHGDQIKVVEMSQMGDCRRECATVAKICTDILGEHDTDVSELLVQGKGRADIANALCHELSGACAASKASLRLQGTREVDEDFVPVDESQVKMQRMLAQMEGDGMSGNIFSRDEAMAQVEEYRDQLEEYDMTPEDLQAMASQQGGGDGAADEL